MHEKFPNLSDSDTFFIIQIVILIINYEHFQLAGKYFKIDSTFKYSNYFYKEYFLNLY